MEVDAEWLANRDACVAQALTLIVVAERRAMAGHPVAGMLRLAAATLEAATPPWLAPRPPLTRQS